MARSDPGELRCHRGENVISDVVRDRDAESQVEGSVGKREPGCIACHRTGRPASPAQSQKRPEIEIEAHGFDTQPERKPAAGAPDVQDPPGRNSFERDAQASRHLRLPGEILNQVVDKWP